MKKIIDKIITYLWLIITGFIFWIFFYAFNRFEIKGKKKTAMVKRILLVSNHQTMIDSFLVCSAIYFPCGIIHPNLIPWQAADEINFFKTPMLDWMARHWKCIPIKRGIAKKNTNQDGGNKRNDLTAHNQLIKILQNDENLLLFPEGSRTRDGKIKSGRTMIGRLIYKTKPLVIPIRIFGMDKVLPIGSAMPKIFKKVRLVIGEPIKLEKFYQEENKGETWKKITKEIMSEIEKL